MTHPLKPPPVPKPLPLPQTGEEILTALQDYHAKHEEWPTLEELLATQPTWNPHTAETRLFYLRGSNSVGPAPVVKDLQTGRYRDGSAPGAPRVSIPISVALEVPKTLTKPGRPPRPEPTELLNRVWAIRAAGQYPSPILSQEYGISSGVLSGWIAEARVANGLPRIEECHLCHDTGTDSMSSQMYCACKAGAAKRKEECDMVEISTDETLTPVLLLLNDSEEAATVTCDDADTPEPGDEWPEIVIEAGRRRVRVWLCTKRADVAGRAVRLMVRAVAEGAA